MITGKNISKRYGDLLVLNDVSFTFNKGEVTAIIGPSGAGKSTLLHIIGTIDKPDSGAVYYNDIEVSKYPSNALARFRNKNIGFIFQFHHLLPELTALENVSIPGYIYGTDDKKVEERAKSLLCDLGLEGRLNHKPGQLSGGEQQRVSVARALLNSPDVILADEPSGNLDSKNANELHELFFKLKSQLNQTFIIVTHNLELAEMADKKMIMKDGAIDKII
jgi:lipoprotein-releasing system ATP-binding protein